MDISQRISILRQSVPDNVTVVAVSKTKPIAEMIKAYNAGLRNFGENKAQEIAVKQPQMPSDTIWHFIGHLQTNKVKLIAPFIHLIHSVDSVNLLKEINKEAIKNSRVIDCLLQFYIATEETKFGLDIQESREILDNLSSLNLNNVRVTGVMGMASFSDNLNLIRLEFNSLRFIFELLKTEYFSHSIYFKEISMGMSGDYRIAIEEGSTMVRIGTSIFGEALRNIQK
ncbi:MAG: YggS family pyridoxal phosphate-dependent enzyme [Bacteroidetes bacterium]|nr:YggS family pyridoxal phosphate-dependent enzyme [Bacteroidota bacterium]